MLGVEMDEDKVRPYYTARRKKNDESSTLFEVCISAVVIGI